MVDQARDNTLKRIYLAGGSRQEAMQASGITNTNSMSSASNRLNLHWKWPLSNRQSGEAPLLTKQTRPARGGFADTVKKPAKKPAVIHKSSMLLEPPAKKEAEIGQFENAKLPADQKDRLIDQVELSKPLGPVSPLHLSDAFPKPEECGLTERDLFWIAQLYVRDFGPPDYA